MWTPGETNYMMSKLLAQDKDRVTSIAASMHVHGKTATSAKWMDILMERGDG